jgi:hypothetical protein
MTFNEFMKEMRAKWLKSGWEVQIRRRILGAKQDTEPFWEWALNTRQLNALIVSTDHGITDDNLREQLEARMDATLCKECDSKKINEEKDLDKWLGLVKDVDEKMREERNQARADVEEIACSLIRKRTFSSTGITEPSHHINVQRRTPATMNDSQNENCTSASTSYKQKTGNIHVPRLTDNERTLLHNNNGCTKCRNFFVGHRALDCPNDWPNAATYRTLTQADVDTAKRNCRGKTAPVAAAVPIDPIASVMPDVGRSDEGDSLSSDEVSKPLPDIPTCKHLVWHCAADDRQSEFFHPTFMTALIDDGSHLVMVTPEIANKLSLKRRKLAKPLKFSVAINDKSTRMNNTDPKDNCTHPPDHRELTECVKLKLYDRTRRWTS